jgi:hypothetical protein
MEKFINLITGLIVICTSIACEETVNDTISNNTEYIKYGTSFGECLGYCNNEIKIINSKIDFYMICTMYDSF